jgi:hypothetical protein
VDDYSANEFMTKDPKAAEAYLKKNKIKYEIYNESVNEKSSGDNALLQKMFKALKTSKNFKSIKMEKPFAPEDWDGAVINIVSKLKGTSEYHKDEVDEFEIGIEKDGSGLILHYTPSGNTEPVKSVADVITMTRANKK